MDTPPLSPQAPAPAYPGSPRRPVQRLALAAAVAAYLLIVLGGIVRVSGSGLGCPDWPLCYGKLIPPLRADALIEYSHRLVASVASFLIVLTAVQAWRKTRADSRIVAPATMAMILLFLQVALGGATVVLEIPPAVVAAHLGLALLILGLLWFVAVPAEDGRAPVEAPGKVSPAGLALLGLVFALLVTGAVVRGSGATAACGGFPLCDGMLWPRHPLGQLQMVHRAFAVTTVVVLIGLALRAARSAATTRGQKAAADSAAVLGLLQAWIGIEGVRTGFPPLLMGLHLATAAALWSAVVITVALSTRRTRTAAPAPGVQAAGGSPRWLGWLMLTKPAILLLLLFSTLAGMVVGGGGWPAGPVLLWTLLGGALTAGGASALNQFTDRRTDALMARTRRRPIPAGAIRPGQALGFGLGLSAGGVALLASQVNTLSAALALAGVLYYVVLYGLVLKKTTPQNIVVGGGAGAIPILVGWAAVSGTVTMAGFLLFALVFFWTPAHFWALALVRKSDYQRAGIPMLPVVVGDPDTRTQILLYAVQVVTLTLLIGAVTREGWLYFGGAISLGMLLLFHALLLWRHGSPQRAWRMYRYSSLYLALYLATLMASTLTRG